MFGLGGQEILLLLVLGVILFGRKLPEIGKFLGQSIVEFKKGINGVEDRIDAPHSPRAEVTAEPVRPPQRLSPTAPKFNANGDAPSA